MNLNSNTQKSIGGISSNTNQNLINNNEDQKENGKNEEIEEVNESEENEDIDEIPEENEENEKEEKEEKKEESDYLKTQQKAGQGKLEKLFIYLRTGFSWRPIPTINSTVLCLEITGAIFVVIGIIILVLSKNIQEIEIRYDDNKNCQINTVCEINFTIPKNMKKDVFVYYRMKNFYQNHRRYIKSKSYKQLKGNIMTEDQIKDDCDPIILNKDIYDGIKRIDEKDKLDPEGVAHPCGLIARSFFNDTYKLKKQGENEEIIITANNIAWSIDKKKYKNSENYTEHQWINVENERFIVWMRPAALPDFRKPWGRIEKELIKGNYTVSITNNYPVKSFDGKKYFILSTVNILGGKNYLLSILYLVIGGFSILSGIFFYIGYKKYNMEKTKIE